MYKKREKKKNSGVRGTFKQYLTFAIAEENYGLELKAAKEIIKPPPITDVPNSEDYIRGVINLRGQVIPVIDLKTKLGLMSSKEAAGGDQRIIVVNVKDMLIGLYVDKIKEIVNLSEEEIGDVSEVKRDIRQDYITGVAIKEKKLIVILSLDNLLFEQEEKRGA